MDQIRFLQGTAPLRNLRKEVLELVVQDLQDIRPTPGEVLFEAGEPGDAVYFIVSGGIRIERDGVDLVSLKAGECVGEFALIDDGPRSASAIANTPTHLLKWNRQDFRKTLSSHPEVAFGMLEMLTQKLRHDVDLQVEVGAAKAKLQNDLQRAREVQMAMLPEKDISCSHFELAGFCQPAEEVGGDYYDYFFLPDGRFAIIIADVAGHGFYSGLLVAMAKSCMHSQVGISIEPDKVMEALNRTVSLSVATGMLMTGCYVVFDPSAERLTYSNAGHNYPILLKRSSGEIEYLESTDPLMGIPGFEETRRKCATRRWEPGDTLLLYSDGITEAFDREDRMFGEDRLCDALLGSAGSSVREVRDQIIESINIHTRGARQQDDMTLVVTRAK